MKTLTESEFRLLVPFVRMMHAHNNRVYQWMNKLPEKQQRRFERWYLDFEDELFDLMGLPEEGQMVELTRGQPPQPFCRDYELDQLIRVRDTDEQVLEFLRWLAKSIETESWRDRP